MTFLLPSDCFGFANSLEFCFDNVFERWLFETQTPTVCPAFMKFDDLWEAGVPDYFDDVLIWGHWYEYVIASRLGLAIGVEDPLVLLMARRFLYGTSFGKPKYLKARDFTYYLMGSDPFSLPPSLVFLWSLPFILRAHCFTSSKRSKVVLMPLVTLCYVTASVQQYIWKWLFVSAKV